MFVCYYYILLVVISVSFVGLLIGCVSLQQVFYGVVLILQNYECVVFYFGIGVVEVIEVIYKESSGVVGVVVGGVVGGLLGNVVGGGIGCVLVMVVGVVGGVYVGNQVECNNFVGCQVYNICVCMSDGFLQIFVQEDNIDFCVGDCV